MVRPGGERTSQAWTVPSVAAEAQSQAAGLALLEAEGETGDEGANGAGGGYGGSNGEDGDGYDAFDVIRTVENAYSQTGGLSMLSGNLAPKGAVVKTAGVSPNMLKHSGPAVIFESEIDAYNGIVFDKVKAGDVVVVRNEGPKGGPGMQEMLAPTTAIKGVGLDDRCRPDHRRPILRRHRRGIDRTRQPRGGRRRPDRPDPGRRHHRHRHPRRRAVGPAVGRRARPPPRGVGRPGARITTGYLARYARMATSADTGAILKWD